MRRLLKLFARKLNHEIVWIPGSLQKLLPVPIYSETINLSPNEESILENFRTHRYHLMNELRWRLLLQAGFPWGSRAVFEPGAGIGDQTNWLLSLGLTDVIVSDGRVENLEIIRKRFRGDPRIRTLVGNLEDCLDTPEFDFRVDITFCWGVYYHILDPYPEVPVLKGLARIAPIVVLDYLESDTGTDFVQYYGQDNPSTSVSHASGRQTKESMISSLKTSFGNVYFPREQMNYFDPSASGTPRRIIIGSKTRLTHPGLIEVE